MADIDDKPDANDGQDKRWRDILMRSYYGWNGFYRISLSPGDFETEVDWEGEHGFFNDPTIKLDSIELSQINGITMKASAKENFESFCRGLSSNRTIEEFLIEGFGPSNVDMFSMLAPFFEHNKKLKRFSSVGGGYLSNSVINAIGRCNNLEDVEVTGNELAGQLISVIAEHNSCLFILSLAESISNWNGCVELAEMIKTSRSLDELNLHHINLGDEELAVLGDALSGGTSIKTLNIGMNTATDNGWRSFAEGLETNSSLETLVVCNTLQIEDAGAAALSTAVVTNQTLKTLDFSGNVCLTPNGWCSFFTTLLGPNSVLESLDVSSCEATNEDHEVVDDEIALALANALASNTSLESLDLFAFNSISSEGLHTLWSSVAHILFNDESLDTVYSSNHVLQKVIREDRESSMLPEKLLSLLRANRNTSNAATIRHKIARYFWERSTVEELVDLDSAGVIPQVLAWAGSDADGSTLMYRLIRRVPSLFGLPAPSSARHKRKRG